MKPRKLTESEVTFTVELEEEDTPVRGNAMASGDDAADKALEDEIIERLDRGDISAWCCLKVTASWNGLTGVDYLGACSFSQGIHQPVEAQAIEYAAEIGMKGEALSILNAKIEAGYAKLAPLMKRPRSVR